jgi:hypothetical protein
VKALPALAEAPLRPVVGPVMKPSTEVVIAAATTVIVALLRSLCRPS